MQLDMKLDTTYKLPRMRYKGAAGPQPQHIRAAPKQLITEARLTRHNSLCTMPMHSANVVPCAEYHC